MKEEKKKLEETLTQKDELIDSLKNQITKFYGEIINNIGIIIPNILELDDPGNLNNYNNNNINLIEIDNESVEKNENESDSLQNKNKEMISDLINEKSQVTCKFRKLTSPKYNVENKEINWNEIIFDEDFILENKPKFNFYFCEICSNIIISPKKCSECEKLFCGRCIDSWLSKDNQKKCPKCRKDFQLRQIGFNEKNILNEMILTCPLNCGEKFAYEKLDLHMKACAHISKIYNCELCHESLIINNENQKELINHDENCSGIIFECNKCFKKLDKQSIEEHKKICKDKLKKCSKCHLNYYEKYTQAHDLFYCEKIESFMNFLIDLFKIFQLI